MSKTLSRALALTALLIFTATGNAGDAEAGKAKTAVCAGCHGADGNSPIAANPKLIGQNEKYIAKQLQDIKSGKRTSPIMAGMVATMSEQDMADVGAYYASMEAPVAAAPAVSDDELAIGERIYRSGNEDTGVAACSGCHGPAGNGNSAARWPRLAGQHAAYTEAQLKAFRLAAQYPDQDDKGRRNDGEDAKMMRGVAATMTDREISAVSAYIQGLYE
jgi:cytochrome c553